MNNNTKKLTVSGLMIALGLVLPFLTGNIPGVGRALLPIHLPVFLCALICGWKYGLLVGCILPLLRSVLFHMPPLYPAIAMSFEMATYGLVTGMIYYRLKNYNTIPSVYAALVPAMILGRVVWGIAQIVLFSMQGNAFTMELFLGGVLFSSIPGIILQLVLIPAIMVFLEKAGVVRRGEMN